MFKSYSMNVSRIILFLIAGIVSLNHLHASHTLLLQGKYQNKNIYIQNALNENGVGYCAYEVRVNGVVTTDEINSSAFEIDLEVFNFKTGDKVEIQIFHKNDCSPHVLNPDAITPRPTFKTEMIAISSAGILTWNTTNETGALTYIVEQYRWNKWIYVGEVQGIGTPGLHAYSFRVTPHSGENKFRVKQSGFGREVRYTPEVKFMSTTDAITYSQSANTRQVFFSSNTLYEIYDVYGQVVIRGYGKAVDLSSFERGKTYYLCYDNQVADVVRKR
jgi:hypothetical protein